MECIKPGSALGDEHLACLDCWRLGGHTRDLVALGLYRDDSETLAAQLLDQTRARAHVFDQYGGGLVVPRLGRHRANKVGKDKFGPIDIQKVSVVVPPYSPGRANRVVVVPSG